MKNKLELKEKKRLAKEFSAEVNKSKREIDRLKQAIDTKKMERESMEGQYGETEVIDEEEFAFFKMLKQQKAEYRKAFEELKKVKDEVSRLSSWVDQSRHLLMTGFEEWYVSRYGAAEPEQSLGPAVDEQGEVLDYGEQFERMEMERIVAEDPDSLSFYNATKSVTNRKGRPARRAANQRA